MAEKEKKITEEELSQLQFAHYISLLAGTAMQHLGKIANPLNGKIEKNLEAAKATIDLLVMLQAKTKGNLSKEEEDLLSGAVADLQLNYVDEAKQTGA